MLYRWIISSCIDQGRTPPAFVRRRMERDAGLRAYAQRLAEIDDRLRRERPRPAMGRPVKFEGVPFARERGLGRGRGVAGRISPALRGIATIAALLLIAAVIAVSVPTGPAPEEQGEILASEIRDLRADAELLGRRILERLPKSPRLTQRVGGRDSG